MAGMKQLLESYEKVLRNVRVWIAFGPVSCAFRLHVDTSTPCVPKFSNLWMWDLNSTKSKKEQRAYFCHCQIHFINNKEIFPLPFRNWQRKIITRSSKLSPQNAFAKLLTYIFFVRHVFQSYHFGILRFLLNTPCTLWLYTCCTGSCSLLSKYFE